MFLDDSFSYITGMFLNLLHIIPKAQAIAPDTQEEEQPQRQEDSGSHVETRIAEGACMGIRHQDGQVVQPCDNGSVAAVMELLHQCLKTVVDADDSAVLHIAEENADIVGHSVQIVHLYVGLTVVDETLQFLGQHRIVGRVDDHVLGVEAAMRPESQQAAEEIAVSLDIEDDAVLVGPIGKEDAHGEQDSSTEPHARDDVPGTGLGHLLAADIYHIIKDKDEHADDHRHAQSALSDDGF